VKAFGFLVGLGSVALLSGCGGGSSVYSKAVPKSDRAHINNKTKFSESAYGVAASPRVTTSRKVRKGGGRRQIGKPYKIKGKWYTPKEDFGYDKIGQASWYGPNFHGRLTANGEIYDQYALTAAHPTFPLPSYARVTNLANGKSLIVRVNDRGPYHPGRVIDLSAKASDMLDYQRAGVARVRVQYIRQAPLHGLDHKMLLASFKTNGSGRASQIAKLSSPSPNRPNLDNLDRIKTGSVKKKTRPDPNGDPFLTELKAVKRNKDTGSTLALRLKKQFIFSGR